MVKFLTYLSDKAWVFIASCVVTDSKKKMVKIRKDELKTLKDNEKIYISWCGAFEKMRRKWKIFQTYEELAGAEIKLKCQNHQTENKKLCKNTENKPKIDLSKKTWWIKNQFIQKKFIVIQGWCDSFCTFCFNCNKRWKHYYKDKEDIVSEITDFESKWWKKLLIAE